MNLRSRNRAIAAGAVLVVAGMVGLAYAAVPLYQLFCQVTGFGGTTQRAAQAPGAAGERIITVRFESHTVGGMPWRFEPAQRKLDVQVGAQTLAFYEALNPSQRTVTGQASFNVTPLKAGRYFDKIDCFCFTEQTLAPGERVDMPVSFFIDPAINDDPNMEEVKTITLSYTFFELEREEAGTANVQTSARAGGTTPAVERN